jgi:hypothetical protein
LELELNNKALDNDLRKKHEENQFWQERLRLTEREKNNQIEQLELEKRKAVEDQVYLKEKESKLLHGEIDRLQERLAQTHALHEETKSNLKKT